tara:strand:- start:76709 stop:78454 length:1746 start_codon:yes stop_codon:yes gene_type:complete
LQSSFGIGKTLKGFNLFRSKLFLVILFSLLILLSFSPYLSAGFYADDAMNSQVTLVAKKQNISVLEFTNKIIYNWQKDVGRYYPLGFLGSYTFYDLFPEEASAHIIQMFLVLINMLLFSGVIYILTSSTSLALLFIPILLLHFQIRDFYDPIAGYAPFMQLMFIYVVGEIVFFLRYLKNGSSKSLIGSCLLFLASLLTYELAIVFLGIFILLTWSQCKSIKKSLNHLKFHLLILFSYISYIIYLRANRTSSYSGTELTTNPSITIESYLHQLGAMLPLSYFSANKFITFETIFSGEYDILPAIGCCLITFVILLLFSSDKREKQKSFFNKDLIFICLGFVFLPPLVVAFSARWQVSVSAGVGYIPVYFSYYGCAFFITFWIHKLFIGNSSKRFFYIAAILFTLPLTSLINHLSNQQSVETQNILWKHPRKQLQSAYKSQLFDSIHGATAVTPKSFSWNSEYLSEKSLSTFASIISVSQFDNKIKESMKTTTIYFLDFRSSLTKRDLDQWVFLSPISYQKNELLYFSNPKFFLNPLSNKHIKVVVSCNKHKEEITFNKEIINNVVSATPFNCTLDKLDIHLE